MATIGEVKQAILSSEYERYLPEGLYCSEPVFQMIEGKLADVFFVYGRNKEATRYVAPVVTFGFFFDEREAAFAIENASIEPKDFPAGGPQADPLCTVVAYQQIDDLYPIVRECAFSVCDDEQKCAVRDYCAAIKEVSGPILWDVYKAAAPGFFDWVDAL